MKSRTWLFAIILSLTVAFPAFAQQATAPKPPAKSQKPAPAATPGSSQAQVAGIIDHTVDGLWDTTDRFWHEGDYHRIVDLCRVIVEADPSFNEAYSNAAYLLWSLGDTPGADNLLTYGLTKTSEKGELSFEFGRHLFSTKRYAEAEKYFKISTEDPRASPVWYAMLGHTYRIEKKYNEAVQVWETVVEKFPKFISGPPNLARVKKLQAGGGQ